MTKLEQAAMALLAHWDTPAWKYLKPTGDLMADLREALAEQAEQRSDSERMEPVACKSVPIELTEDMLLAAELSQPRGYRELYVAMISAAPVQQAEQEPVAYDWDTIHQVLCEVWNRDSSADEGLEAIQDLIYSEPTIEAKEPVARVPAHPEQGLEWLKPPPVWGTPLYASPVRTKDLTDEEIEDAVGWTMTEQAILDCRAVIAADREKNRG